MHDRFIPAERVPYYFSSSDVVLLPHTFQAYGSASGVLHLAMGSLRPIICSRSQKFLEVEGLLQNEQDERDIFIPPLRISRWTTAMRRMAGDEDFRNRWTMVLAEYAKRTEWPEIARLHRLFYEQLLTSSLGSLKSPNVGRER
jgi:hypothetical protein